MLHLLLEQRKDIQYKIAERFELKSLGNNEKKKKLKREIKQMSILWQQKRTFMQLCEIIFYFILLQIKDT